MDLILNYFPTISENQRRQFEMLMPLYADWNAQINLISRKDFEHFYERHVLHSLAIARFIQFASGTKVIDIGTGGGFPGIPLAILFPEVHFTLVDSIGKKIMVVNDVVEKLGLENVLAINQRAEQLAMEANFVISRATAPLSELVDWTQHLIAPGKTMSLGMNGVELKSGWIALKGGDLDEELAPFGKKVQVKPIADFFEEAFFETKKIVYLPNE